MRRLLPVAVVVLALQTVRDQIPGLDQIRPVVADGELAWIGAALLAEIVSMSLFARQQTNLLKGVGVHAGLGGALALAYTRSALSISMPAGTAVSAGYAYQRFRRWGASPEAATAVMIMSGVFSFVSLALLYVAGFLLTFLTAPVSTWRDQPILTPAVLAVSAATAALLIRHRLRARASLTIDGPVDEEDLDFLATCPDAADTPGRPIGSGLVRTQLRRLAQLLRDVAAVAESMPRRHRTTALGLSALNWLADLACLAAVAQAFHLPLDLLQLGTVYVAAQLVRQIPITPGGIGVIEATLLAALTAAGAEPAAAAATVLGYRLLSCWLVIPAGLTTWAFLRRADRRASAWPAEATAPAQRASEVPVPATANPALATPSRTTAAAVLTPETAQG